MRSKEKWGEKFLLACFAHPTIPHSSIEKTINSDTKRQDNNAQEIT